MGCPFLRAFFTIIFLKKYIDNIDREEYNLHYNIKHIIPSEIIGNNKRKGWRM